MITIVKHIEHPDGDDPVATILAKNGELRVLDGYLEAHWFPDGMIDDQHWGAAEPIDDTNRHLYFG